jgi:hypothetical protein
MRLWIRAFISCLLLSHYAVFSQYYSFEHMKTTTYTGNILSSDDKGNILIGSNNKVIKLDMNGEFIAQYYPNFQGKVSSIDAKDPRRILVYYSRYAYVVFLNQEMRNVGSPDIYQSNIIADPISLDDLNLSYTKLACLDEYEEAFWVYDDNNSDIVLIDKEIKIDFRGDALDEYTELEPNPNFMVMESNLLFINNPASGVYVFDENGRFVRKLNLMGLKKIQVNDDQLSYLSNNFLVLLNLKTNEETYHPLPEMIIKDWTVSWDVKPARINFLTDKGVKIYSIEQEN